MHLEGGARCSVVDDAISIFRRENLSGSKCATENVRNFLFPQPSAAQVLVFGCHHDAAVAGQVAIHEDGGWGGAYDFDWVEACVEDL